MAKVIWVEDVVCWPHFRKPEVLQLFVYLLDKADENGNIVTTNSTICHELGMSPRTLRTCLHHLVATNKTTSKATNKNTHLTICNFASYKAEKIATDKQNDKQTDKPKETNKENISPTPPIKENKKESLKESPINGAKESCRFLPPTVLQVQEYIQERGYAMSAERFVDFYTSKNWYIGKNKMKDWRAAVRNWASRNNDYGQKSTSTSKAEHIAAERERIMREVLASSKH